MKFYLGCTILFGLMVYGSKLPKCPISVYNESQVDSIVNGITAKYEAQFNHIDSIGYFVNKKDHKTLHRLKIND